MTVANESQQKKSKHYDRKKNEQYKKTRKTISY